MKKALLLLGIPIFLLACAKADLKNKAVEKITVAGKVVDKDNHPVEQCKVFIYESSFMTYSIAIKDTATSESGEFALDFSPRQDENFMGAYHLLFEKRGYYADEHYSISKQEAQQYFEVVMEKSE
jgi:protocatechuate 3,4-dioxygenase beta subunit